MDSKISLTSFRAPIENNQYAGHKPPTNGLIMNISPITTVTYLSVNQTDSQSYSSCRPLKRKLLSDDQKDKVVNKIETNIRNVVDPIPICLGRDESYPEELKKLIQPLACNLCRTRFNSLHSAKDHYGSRIHDRGISNWLSKNFTEKGLEPPAIKRLIKESSTGSTNTYYCEACDLQLTSLSHANQHYSGRKHQMVVSGQCKPSGGGYYTTEGKWIRTSTKASVMLNDGRFGIGESFKTVAQGPIYCEICGITVTSASQMQTHLEGTKHRKKLSSPENGGSVAIETCISNVGSAVAVGKDDDLSNYRTPNGTYYCSVCNIPMSHASVVRLHLKGKKHIKREKLVISSGISNSV